MSLHRWIDRTAWNNFTRSMWEKLAIAREKGRSGWHDPEQMDDGDLAGRLVSLLVKENEGNFVDIAIYCMFLNERKVPPETLARAVERRDFCRSVGFTQMIRHLQDIIDHSVVICPSCQEEDNEPCCHEAGNLRFSDNGKVICQLCWETWERDDRSWEDLPPLKTW